MQQAVGNPRRRDCYIDGIFDALCDLPAGIVRGAVVATEEVIQAPVTIAAKTIEVTEDAVELISTVRVTRDED